jgi:hypothetical protein
LPSPLPLSQLGVRGRGCEYVLKNFRKDKVHFALCFYTRGLPCFNELRSLFYINRVKIVPKDIYNLLTPVALAHLIMGDGVAKQFGLIICTDVPPSSRKLPYTIYGIGGTG